MNTVEIPMSLALISPQAVVGPGEPAKSALQRFARTTGSPPFSLMTEGIAASMLGGGHAPNTPTTGWLRCQRDYRLQQLTAQLTRKISESQRRDNIGGRC